MFLRLERLPDGISVVFRIERSVLRGLVHGVPQDEVLVLDDVRGDAVAHLRALLAELRLTTETASFLRILIRNIHSKIKYYL